MRHILSVFIVLLTLGGVAWAVPWTTGFEDEPANTDPAAAGAASIRQLKNEIRLRLRGEMCFGPAIGSGCTTSDTGRQREGSARIYINDVPPASLGTADYAGSTALDNGRMAYKPTTGQVCFRSSGSWVCRYALPISPAPTTGDYVKWDGTEFVYGTPDFAAFDQATIPSQTIPATTFTIMTSTGGAGTNNHVSATVPSEGDWVAEIQADGTACNTHASGSRTAAINLVTDPNGTPAVRRATTVRMAAADSQSFSFHDIIEGLANDAVLTVGLQAAGTTADVSLGTASGCNTVTDQTAPTGRITIKLTQVD